MRWWREPEFCINIIIYGTQETSYTKLTAAFAAALSSSLSRTTAVRLYCIHPPHSREWHDTYAQIINVTLHNSWQQELFRWKDRNNKFIINVHTHNNNRHFVQWHTDTTMNYGETTLMEQLECDIKQWKGLHTPSLNTYSRDIVWYCVGPLNRIISSTDPKCSLLRDTQ